MINSYMSFQVTQLIERFVTHLTMMCLLVGMNFHVVTEMALFSKALFAIFTLKRFFARMNSFMSS